LRVVGLAAAMLAACTRTTELFPAGPSACVAPGPVISFANAGGGAACAGTVAANAARFALCACTDLVLTGNFIVNSIGAASLRGPGPGGASGNPPTGASPGQPAATNGSPWPGGFPVNGLLPKSFFAAVGTDGNLQVSGHGDVPGTLVTAGGGDAQLGREGHVLGNAHVAGGLRPGIAYWISNDAYVGGDVAGHLVVGGALHAPVGATMTADAQAGSIVREPVKVAPPCNCGAGPGIDVAAAVEARRTRNANPALPFSEDVLDEVVSAQTLDLPCGEYYLETLRSGSGGALELRIHGHVGIFVAGDVRLGDNLTVTLDAGATLDLVVAGSFYTTGRVFGSPASPAGTRLWVGSTTVSLPDQVQFGAFVYAPAAVFSAGAGMTFSGSLFVGTLSVAGDVRLGFDPALLQQGAACGAAVPTPIE
jgi:hypothetical protein